MVRQVGMYLKALVINILAFSLVTSSGSAEEIAASPSKGISLTIYNQNFGLVRDTRSINLKKGINHLRLEDIAAQIDPTSVSFVSLTAPNSVVVREQNYQFDLMNPNTVLSKSIGKRATFRQFLSSGQVSEISGILLNSPLVTVGSSSGISSTQYQQLVIRTDDGIILNPQGQVELASLPEGLVSKPSLLWKLEAGKPGEHQTEIAYQTGGLNWRCDYVAVLNQDDTKSDLTSWVTIDNQSGATYKNAALKLLAGDVHRVQPDMARMPMETMRASEAAMAEPQFKERAFAEYHLYTLQGTTDVNQNETKQMSLFNANEIPAKKLFIYEDQGRIGWYGSGSDGSKKVNVKIEIENSKANNLGIPMPKGKVRVYKKDEDKALQFIGEDEIDHTPRDEKLRLYIGDAFDLVGERKQLSARSPSPRIQEYSYEISLRNHKEEAVTITAVEHTWGDWRILSASHAYKKKDSQTFEFTVDVPAGGEVKITYDIRVRT